MNSGIRKVVKEDVSELKEVLDSIELFPSEYLDDMISDYFENPDSQDIWFTKVENGIPIAIGYCAPEKFTEGTYNLYAIGIKNELQGKGIGSEMMAFIEDLLREEGHRILIVETSGSDEFELTRKFYLNLDYIREATIRDFWSEGDDKVIFWKKLKDSE